MVPVFFVRLTISIPEEESKPEMVPIRFSSFLVLVLISLQATHLAADSHQGAGFSVVTKGKEFEVTRSILVSVNKGDIGEVPAGIGAETKLYGGRKMKLERDLKENAMLKVEALRLEDSKISGRDAYVSKKYPGYPQGHMKHQTKRSTVEVVSVNWRNQKVSSAEAFRYKLPTSEKMRSGSTSVSKEQFPENLDEASQNLQSQKLLAAASEIANLMNKDYPGGGQGHHKPPINNVNPLSEEHNNLP